MSKEVTRLIVKSSADTLNVNLDSGVSFTSRRIVIQEPKRFRFTHPVRLASISQLRSVTTVDLVIQKNRQPESHPLSQLLSSRLARFLRGEGYDVTRADCGYFAHYMNGFPYDGFIDEAKWNFSPYIDDKHLQAGDTILMSLKTDKSAHPRHMAIYLTDGLYLSKFGRGPEGHLIVATLWEMYTAFGGSFVSVMKPRLK